MRSKKFVKLRSKSISLLFSVLSIFLLIAGGVFFFSMPTPAIASSTLTFYPTADAYVNQSQPKKNFGIIKDLRTDESPFLISYMQFSIHGIGSSKVSKVTLQVYSNNNSQNGFTIHKVADNNWQEQQLNYQNAPAMGDQVGQSQGYPGHTMVSVDVTSLLSTDGTVSLALVGVDNSMVDLASRESPKHQPQLMVEIVPFDTPTPTSTSTKISAAPTSTMLPTDPPATATPTSTFTPTEIPVTATSVIQQTLPPATATPTFTSTPTNVPATSTATAQPSQPPATVTPTSTATSTKIPATSTATVPPTQPPATVTPSSTATPTKIPATATPTATPTMQPTTPAATATTTATPTQSPSPTPTSAGGTGQVPDFSHVITIIFENKEYGDVIGSSSWPNLNRLASQYTNLINFYAETHPSLPNYLAATSGSTQGITSDCTNCFINAPNIADQGEQSGRTWKAYMESMPSPCYLGDSGNYAQKHNPFVYYDDIRTNTTRCDSHDVPLTQLDTDLTSGNLPNYVWITPNLCNDAHDCSGSIADAWLGNEVNKILSSPSFDQNSLLVITFDEGTTGASCCSLPSSAGGHIPTILVSSLVKSGYQDATPYDHYSLMKTIEKAWGLSNLVHAGDAGTNLITVAWK